MYLIKPQGQKLKWDIGFRNHDGRIVKIPGDRDRAIARRIGERAEMLVKAKQNGDPAPGELATWIDNMPAKLADRLVTLGLLTPRRLIRCQPLSDHIKDYGATVAARKSNKADHATQQESKVRRICAGMKIGRYDDLTADGLLKYLASLGLATATRRGHIIAMKDFAIHMVSVGAATKNPFENVVPPGQYENPEYERQPLSIIQFQKLMKHMGTFERYHGQRAKWTAKDRQIVYWTAVKTGYRESELKALRKANLYLNEKPAVVSLKARHTKNKTVGEVPIPDDLARALKQYVAHLAPADLIFPFPSTSGSIVDMFRRDLTGAGIAWELPTGEVVDFHALRSTAITWWLDVDGLSPKRVQVLARLKTLALVQNYSRNLRLEEFGWLNKGPKLVAIPASRRSA